MSRMTAWTRWSILIALATGYVMLAHHTIITPGHEALGTLIALCPIFSVATSFALQHRRKLLMITLLALVCIVLALTWSTLIHHYSRIYWLEHAGSQAALGLIFARSLGPGQVPMCTRIARIITNDLPLEIERYTRQVTIAWVIFFSAMATISSVLYIATPLAIWSVFANFLTAPLICLMFIGEYAVRRSMHQDIEHAPILAIVKAYWNSPAER